MKKLKKLTWTYPVKRTSSVKLTTVAIDCQSWVSRNFREAEDTSQVIDFPLSDRQQQNFKRIWSLDTYVTVNSGPAQLLFPKEISPSEKEMSYVRMKDIISLMSTVVPSRRDSVNPLPAGTVNPLRVTVVHLTAFATSSIREIRTCVIRDVFSYHQESRSCPHKMLEKPWSTRQRSKKGK